MSDQQTDKQAGKECVCGQPRCKWPNDCLCLVCIETTEYGKNAGRWDGREMGP